MADSENVKWIDWTGGACPVDDDIKVEVRFRNSGVFVSSAGARHWGHNDDPLDIIAYRVLKEAATEAPKPDADGWIKWTGGECPVDDDTEVEVRMVAGFQRSSAGKLRWGNVGGGFDIIAYRVVEEAATEAPTPAADGWVDWAGGERPVDWDTEVEVQLRNGLLYSGWARSFQWGHSPSPGDIIAYRVVEEAASPAADSADLAQETLQSLGWHFDGTAWVQEVPKGESILTTAQSIIYGDRERTYGSPQKNLDTIAAYWTAHLQAREMLVKEDSLTFEDVAIMMTALKLARLANDPTHKDSQVDGCGYLALLARCQEVPRG